MSKKRRNGKQWATIIGSSLGGLVLLLLASFSACSSYVNLQKTVEAATQLNQLQEDRARDLVPRFYATEASLKQLIEIAQDSKEERKELIREVRGLRDDVRMLQGNKGGIISGRNSR